MGAANVNKRLSAIFVEHPIRIAGAIKMSKSQCEISMHARKTVVDHVYDVIEKMEDFVATKTGISGELNSVLVHRRLQGRAFTGIAQLKISETGSESLIILQ